MAKKAGAPTKSEIVAQICKETKLSRKQVVSVFDSLGGVVRKSLRSAGIFTLPGLVKMRVVKKPATKDEVNAAVRKAAEGKEIEMDG